jgi:hypothetical protein
MKYTIEEVLYHERLSDDYKFNYVLEYFNIPSETLSDDEVYNLVEFEFKKWRANNLNSSNVRRVMYNDESREMFIQFQDKSIYTYLNVSFDLFMKIANGDATCITTGENKYGSWFVGKTPSNGSAVHKWLIKAGVSYKKGGSLQ